MVDICLKLLSTKFQLSSLARPKYYLKSRKFSEDQSSFNLPLPILTFAPKLSLSQRMAEANRTHDEGQRTTYMMTNSNLSERTMNFQFSRW